MLAASPLATPINQTKAAPAIIRFARKRRRDDRIRDFRRLKPEHAQA